MSADEVRSKVQRMLAEELGSVRVAASGSFVVTHGSTVTFVDVEEWGDDSTLIRVYSWLLTEVPTTPELYEWAATEGQGFNFGSSKVVPDPDNPALRGIMFRHTLLGDFLDKDELLYAVIGIATSGDQLDDELQARFGGKKFTDPTE